MIKSYIIFPIIFLTSCIAPPSLYKEAYDTSIKALKKNKISVNQSIKNIPYAMQIMEIGNGNEAIVVLSTANNNHLLWSSASKEFIKTFNGKIIKTTGLENDINIYNPPNIEKIFIDLSDGKLELSHKSLINFSKPKTSSMEIFYSYSINKTDIIVNRLNDRNIKTKILIEDINIPLIRFRTQNMYWIDENNKVIKSRQKITPNTGVVKLTSLKRYNGK